MNTVPVNFMRNSPLTSQDKNHRKGAYLHKYSSSQIFPLKNHQLKKIESQNLIEFISNVSHAKLNKKNVTFIPLLKGIQLGSNKYEVYRAADNKFKILSNEKSYGKFKRITQPLYEKIERKGSLICPQPIPHRRSYSSVSLHRQKRQQNFHQTHTLLVSGQSKQISPEKIQTSHRNSSVLSLRRHG